MDEATIEKLRDEVRRTVIVQGGWDADEWNLYCGVLNSF
jgi:hypothetical protein